MKLDKAFPATPKTFETAVKQGIRKGEKRMKFKNKLKLSAVCALAAVFVMVIALAGGNQGTGDPVASSPQGGQNESMLTPTPTPAPADAEEVYVYATEHGVYYHSDPTCQGMANAQVYSEQQALEMGKKPCPVCLSDWAEALDLANYEQRALTILEEVFPGSLDRYTEHYIIEEIAAHAEYNSAEVIVTLSANSFDIGIVIFDETESWKLELYFNDRTLPYQIADECKIEGQISERLSNLELASRRELLRSLLDTLNNQTIDSSFNKNLDDYVLTTIGIYHSDAGYDLFTLTYWGKNLSIVSFTFDLQENDELIIISMDYDMSVWA